MPTISPGARPSPTRFSAMLANPKMAGAGVKAGANRVSMASGRSFAYTPPVPRTTNPPLPSGAMPKPPAPFGKRLAYKTEPSPLSHDRHEVGPTRARSLGNRQTGRRRLARHQDFPVPVRNRGAVGLPQAVGQERVQLRGRQSRQLASARADLAGADGRRRNHRSDGHVRVARRI